MRLFALLALAGLCPVASAQTAAPCPRPAPRLLSTPVLRTPVSPLGTLFRSRADSLGLALTRDSATVMYAASLWIGAKVGGALRVNARTWDVENTFGGFTAGPLTASGTVAPDACSRFNHVWIVTQADLDAYAARGTATSDLLTWPADAGAPVVDGDGVEGNYDLAAGDRPALVGSATAWYVVHDLAPGPLAQTPPMGLELQVTMGSTGTEPSGSALPSALVVRYRLLYKPATPTPLTDAYVGIWNDGDVGNRARNYIGTDSTLGLFYTYDATNTNVINGNIASDPGHHEAVGVQVLQGPRVDRTGDGVKESRLGATSSSTFVSGVSVDGFPQAPLDVYRYLQAIWTDGRPLTVGGRGIDGTVRTRFIYPGTPPGFWTQDDTDGSGRGADVRGADRWGLLSSGPFSMQPGETQDLLVAFPVATAADRLSALAALRGYAALLRGQYPVARADDARLPTGTLSLSLAPNPARTVLRVTVRTATPGEAATVMLFDALGRQVRTLAVGEGGAFTADVSALSPGLYLVRAEAGGVATWQRLVVAR